MVIKKTIKEALRGASFCLQEAGIERPHKEAEYLLTRIMKTDRLRLFLSREELISPEIVGVFQDAVERRCRKEPAAYIAGEKYFYGNRFIVNRDVLIPRPETELLVDCAVNWPGRQGSNSGRPISCVDLGTGSGVLAVTLALLMPGMKMWAVDCSEAALKIARLNAAEHGVLDRICFLQGNYFNAFDNAGLKLRFNIVVANPPYLAIKELQQLPAGVRDYEPIRALDGGKDGLEGYRLILARLGDYMAAPGVLLMEVGAGQKDEVERLCSDTGLFSFINWHSDLNGWPRVIEGFIS